MHSSVGYVTRPCNGHIEILGIFFVAVNISPATSFLWKRFFMFSEKCQAHMVWVTCGKTLAISAYMLACRLEMKIKSSI